MDSVAILLGAMFILKNNTVSYAATKVDVNIGGKNFTATLHDNASAKAFTKHLPESFNMSELNGNEKYKYLDYELPADEKKVGTIHAGDIMLYGDDCIVIFLMFYGKIMKVSENLRKWQGTKISLLLCQVMVDLNRLGHLAQVLQEMMFR